MINQRLPLLVRRRGARGESPLPWLGVALLVAVAMLAAACFGGDEAPAAGDSESNAAVEQQGPAVLVPLFDDPSTLSFANDPALEAFTTREALSLPGRFALVERDDREPILSLGMAESAARVTYNSASTNEVLSFDILRLEPGVDSDEFFTAFADALTDVPDLFGSRSIGVPRGIGEAARHYVFVVGDDDAEAAVILRGDVLALITYRRPPDLRRAVDVGLLLRELDQLLQDG